MEPNGTGNLQVSMGAFYETPLHDRLQKLAVNTLVVCGCNFPNYPRTTVYEAGERDYKIVFVEDAVSGIYKKGKEELKNIGVHLRQTADVLEKVAPETGIVPE